MVFFVTERSHGCCRRPRQLVLLATFATAVFVWACRVDRLFVAPYEHAAGRYEGAARGLRGSCGPVHPDTSSAKARSMLKPGDVAIGGAVLLITAAAIALRRRTSGISASYAVGRRAVAVAEASQAETAGVQSYDHSEIESRWQAFWDEHQTFKTPERKPDSDRPKKYILDMFPYPSGQGLHVGHPLGYTATDVYARFFRARGHDVLHPMGWDAFGLPAEQYAIQTGQHPADTTRKNISTFKRQLKSLGFSYDWGREVATIDDEYVKWTQWIFLQLFKKELAFQQEKPVNWCEALGTVLANEEVIDGKSERGDHPVTRLPIRQWILKIGLYADKLLEDLEGVDWPAGTIDMQKAWIGQSEGASVTFRLEAGEGSDAKNSEEELSLEVFTTRPDTLFGVTHVVMAPEHPLVDRICSAECASEASDYVKATAQKSDRDRETDAKASTGKPLGAFAVHPLTGEKLPVWIADYVLGSYGTGAVMAVPAHDERDFTFATKHGLPTTKVVVAPKDGKSKGDKENGGAFSGAGVSCNSADPTFDGLPTVDMKSKVIDALAAKGVGERKVQYRLSDWLFSRQRYWGEPIPIYFPCTPDVAAGASAADFDPRRGDPVIVDYSSPIPVDESELPLQLPPMEDFSPTGDAQGRLAQALEWRFFQKDSQWFCRESNTMPQWAGSCWYYLRYCDPSGGGSAPVSSEAERAWMPVDLYVGGKEHAVLHLLYARFWHKVLYEIGVAHTKEPFQKLVHQGLILGTDGEKMSKSRGNVVNPDDIIGQFGADALRLYEMSMGPLENEKPWQTEQISGVVRFRDRVHKICGKADANAQLDKDTEVMMHKTIKAVTELTEKLSFNTAITSMIVFANHLEKMANKGGAVPGEAADALARLVHPYAPHLAEECWQRLLGKEGSISAAPWPQYREELCVESEISIPVQVNGKSVKVAVSLPKGSNASEVESAALALEKVQRAIQGKEIKKCIYVPDRIINFIAK